MRVIQQSVMQRLYSSDVWDGFNPSYLPKAVQGWNGDHPSLSRVAGGPGSKIVVDVGVWKGQSTIAMAKAMKQSGIDGCVIAVDTFLGSPEHWNGSPHLFVRQHGLPDLYQQFMSNVYHAGVKDYVIPLPQTSIAAAELLQRAEISAFMAHVDAAHEYEEVIRDAEAYWKILLPGGWLIGDDYHATWPGVVRAAGEFSARHRTAMHIESPKWIVRKPALRGVTSGEGN